MEHIITLKVLSSAGYQWIPVPTNNYKILDEKYAVDSDKIGSPSFVTFKLLALTEEPFKVTFNLKRPWQDTVKETKVFKFNE